MFGGCELPVGAYARRLLVSSVFPHSYVALPLFYGAFRYSRTIQFPYTRDRNLTMLIAPFDFY
jgi:hypothetical protein